MGVGKADPPGVERLDQTPVGEDRRAPGRDADDRRRLGGEQALDDPGADSSGRLLVGDDHDFHRHASSASTWANSPLTNVATTRRPVSSTTTSPRRPGSERAAIVEPQEARRRGGHRGHRLGGSAPGERHEVAHRLIEREVTAGERAVGRPHPSRRDIDVDLAEPTPSRLETEHRRRVRDEHQSVWSERPPRDAHRQRIDVDPVADQSCDKAVIGERRADRARRPVAERRHGIEQMGHRRRTGALRVGHASGIGVGVPNRDRHAFTDELLDDVESTGQLRRDRDHDDARVPRPALDQRRRRRLEPAFRVRAAARRSEHRTFEVEPDRDRSPTAGAGSPVSRKSGRPPAGRARDDRRHERGDAVADEFGTELDDAVRLLGDVDPVGTVDLGVDEAGRHDQAGGIEAVAGSGGRRPVRSAQRRSGHRRTPDRRAPACTPPTMTSPPVITSDRSRTFIWPSLAAAWRAASTAPSSPTGLPAGTSRTRSPSRSVASSGDCSASTANQRRSSRDQRLSELADPSSECHDVDVERQHDESDRRADRKRPDRRARQPPPGHRRRPRPTGPPRRSGPSARRSPRPIRVSRHIRADRTSTAGHHGAAGRDRPRRPCRSTHGGSGHRAPGRRRARCRC